MRIVGFAEHRVQFGQQAVTSCAARSCGDSTPKRHENMSNESNGPRDGPGGAVPAAPICAQSQAIARQSLASGASRVSVDGEVFGTVFALALMPFVKTVAVRR